MQDYIWVPAMAGFIAQLLSLLEVSKLEPSRRPDFRNWMYWLPYIIAPLLGAFAGFYTFHDSTPAAFSTIQGVQVGIGAPLLIKGLVSSIPQGNRPT